MANKKKPVAPALFDVPEGQAASRPPVKGNEPERDTVETIMYCLTAPYMYYPPWEDIWKVNDNRTTATFQRFARAREISETEMCTEFEAMLYISTATLENPPSYHWTQVYMYLFRRHFGAEKADDMELGAPAELDLAEQGLLAGLRRWIFNKRVAHMKAKQKGEAEVARAEAEEAAERPRLFD